jgi:putative addiction module component (TIGR02574 family)
VNGEARPCSVSGPAADSPMMSNALRRELFKLSTAEKLELVEELWDSIPEKDEALELTAEQREDLDRRLAEADADPDGGMPWEEARERIRQRRR